MKSRKLICVAALTLFATVPTALASTTRYVNGVTGSDSNNCLSPTTACKTIGHAISLSASGDSIRVASAIYKENLSIAINLNIFGSGATTTIIDGGRAGTVITVSSTSAHVTLSGLTIRNGSARPLHGGGIHNAGTLTVSNTTVSGNGAPFAGGGIWNGGTLTISNTTISGNIAHLGSGGGIVNFVGTLTINNSALSGNITGYEGGGIFNNSGTLTISNTTISGNSSARRGGGISNGGKLTINNSTLAGNRAFKGGGGIAGSATLQNSIVANNSGGNCFNSVTSNGYNLSSDGSCDFDGPGDRNNTNPMLGPLANNGGPTKTMALLPGSPAIDSGNPSGCTDSLGHLLKTDQRGQPRPNPEDTGGCDMGAYERQKD